MKFIKDRFLIAAAGLLMVCLPSCDLEEANVNPNNTTDAAVPVLLASTQGNLVWAINDFAAQSTSTLVQHLSGTLNVQLNVTTYKYLPTNFQTTWNDHFYAGTMKDLKTIIDKSTENPAYLHYRGVAKIQMAIALGYIVDLWGDAPYTTALDLERNPKPTYDRGADLYAEMFKLFDEGVADLNSPSALSPSTNDRFFPATSEALWRTNSIPRWIKTVNALKARYQNHLSKIDAQGSAQKALDAIAAGTFTSNADELKVSFGSTSDTAGPWYQFLQGSFGLNNIAISQEFITLLNDRVSPGVDDPRLRFYVTDNVGSPDADGNYIGTPYGATIPTGAAKFGPYVNTPGAPTNIITYAEVKFIEAEANFRLNKFTEAAAALNAAIKASILRVTGAADAAYEAKYASETAATIQVDGLQKIFTEKYIALFLETEAWTDWRRSIPAGAAGTTNGIPAIKVLSADVTGTNGVFPRRFLYPTSEIDNNVENITSTSMTERVFWDL